MSENTTQKTETKAFLAVIKRNQAKFVPYEHCALIMEGLLNYCNSLGVSGFPQIDGVVTDVTDVASLAGANEIIVTVQFKAERNAEWYKQLGLLAYLLAKNPGGRYPRKVDLDIHYMENISQHKFMAIKLIVHLYVIKQSSDEGRTMEFIQ